MDHADDSLAGHCLPLRTASTGPSAWRERRAACFEAFAESVGAVPDASFPYVLLAALTAGILMLANAAATVPARAARRLAPAPLLTPE